ncbi:hypothetical protein [Pseudomonas panipatensis]|uniref:hypothetical protein n=1 Tax=Pseudomonas panipatensis TaxID=428992 RepID=UPI0035AEA340
MSRRFVQGEQCIDQVQDVEEAAGSARGGTTKVSLLSLARAVIVGGLAISMRGARERLHRCG